MLSKYSGLVLLAQQPYNLYGFLNSLIYTFLDKILTLILNLLQHIFPREECDNSENL
jgi:hypothetical protein